VRRRFTLLSHGVVEVSKPQLFFVEPGVKANGSDSITGTP